MVVKGDNLAEKRIAFLENILQKANPEAILKEGKGKPIGIFDYYFATAHNAVLCIGLDKDNKPVYFYDVDFFKRSLQFKKTSCAKKIYEEIGNFFKKDYDEFCKSIKIEGLLKE